MSRRNAPRGKILRLSVQDLNLANATVIVPESEGSFEQFSQDGNDQSVVATATKLYVKTINGGPNDIRFFDHLGKDADRIPLPTASSADNLLNVGGDDVLFRVLQYTSPTTYYRFSPATGLKPTSIREIPAVDLSSLKVERVFATSKDGTKVPMTLVYKNGIKRDGTNPTLVYGYGGFGLSTTPEVSFPIWLEQGGIFAATNIRGGGEYGDAWHQSGMLLQKQNVFDDFTACARYLIDNRYTSPEHLAAIGGSNGGLLMGAALTQHPNLFRAVVSFVGIYDMLRVELDPNGAFNTTEYGTVKDPRQFQALYAYSPLHHVDDGVTYPAALFLTGDNDGRVNPAHSRKMVARLQAANRSSYPILLRTSASSGHGLGTARDELIEQMTDTYAFLFDQLGISFHIPGTEAAR